MTIDHNSGDSSSNSSPRISFSHDLHEIKSNQSQEKLDITRQDMSLLIDQNFDFNFCASTSLPENESCPADELFFNGVIIPIQMKHKLNSIAAFENKEDEEITSSTTATLVRQEKNSLSKSFWRFRRSSSLNYENYGQKKSSSMWSLPLLFRSKSTGSSSNYNPKQIQRNCSSNYGKLMNNQTARISGGSCQKPPLLRKSGSGGGGSTISNGLRNSAALNVPPPYITKGTSDLLGFGVLFRNGLREKNKK